jgi:hypothetical protein
MVNLKYVSDVRPATMRPDETDLQQASPSMNHQLQTSGTIPDTTASEMNEPEPQRLMPVHAAAPNQMGSDLVGQLQKAVRDEMRRIMEVC